MSSIYCHVTNSTGELDKFKEMIASAFEEVKQIVENELEANKIDVIFISAAGQTIPEYGLGGHSPSPHYVYVSLDPGSDKITRAGIIETLLHEMHHCMRWRGPGYGTTLGEAMITEGLACLYEAEHSGKPPIYADTKLQKQDIAKAKELLNLKDYDHSEWFFGRKEVSRWFGYTYG